MLLYFTDLGNTGEKRAPSIYWIGKTLENSAISENRELSHTDLETIVENRKHPYKTGTNNEIRELPNTDV
jgi:hypothetical protein